MVYMGGSAWDSMLAWRNVRLSFTQVVEGKGSSIFYQSVWKKFCFCVHDHGSMAAQGF